MKVYIVLGYNDTLKHVTVYSTLDLARQVANRLNYNLVIIEEHEVDTGEFEIISSNVRQ